MANLSLSTSSPAAGSRPTPNTSGGGSALLPTIALGLLTGGAALGPEALGAAGTLLAGKAATGLASPVGQAIVNNPASPAIVSHSSASPGGHPTAQANSGNPAGTGISSGGVAGGSSGGYSANNSSAGYGSASGGALASPSYDPATLAAFDQSIGNLNSAVDRLPNQLNIGNQNIDSAYNKAYNQLEQAKAQNQQQYDTSKTQNQQGFVTTKNTIGANAGNQLNSLQRLLAAHGAAGSSAYQINAPQSVARDASLQRTAAGTTYGHNQQNLDTNWNNYLTGVNNSEQDLGNQRTNNKNSLQASIDNNRASILQQLASLSSQRSLAAGGTGIESVQAAQPFLDQANGLISAADNLGLQTPTFQVAPTAYTAPSLDSYVTNPFAAPISGGNQGANDFISPSLAFLLGGGQKKETNNNNLAASPIGG